MSRIKLTKNEFRFQQKRLTQLERYLPTLQLKKSLLQIEVNNAKAIVETLHKDYEDKKAGVEEFAGLCLEKVDCDLLSACRVIHVSKVYENIAGVEVPFYQGTSFPDLDYFYFDTPVWFDSALFLLREMVAKKEERDVVKERLRALEKELREVSIRVNLFEKVLIPRARENIKKIRIFLGDQFLAAVAQAKVAKGKILAKKAS